MTDKNIDKPGATLVHEATGKPVAIGDKVVDRDGVTHYVQSILMPHKPDSTGRLYVSASPDLSCPVQGYFPSVFGAVWIGRADQGSSDTGTVINGEKFDYLTLQHKGAQLGWCIYGWGTYKRSSVLAGQPMKVFIDSYGDGDEGRAAALAAYPQATPSSAWTEPQVSLSHLPGEDDPVEGGMYPDDIGADWGVNRDY
jgi:hypothetical protein